MRIAICGVADDQRDDLRGRAARRRSPRGRARRAARRRWPGASPRGAAARPGCSSAASAAAATGGGSAVEKISERAVLTRYLRHRLVAAGVRAVGAERLAQRADDHVDLALEPGLGDRAAAARAQRAGAVRLVDHHARVVAAGELDDLGQRRDVAVHREDAVGDDQRAAAVGLAQAPREVLDVAVVVDEGLRPGEPAAVDDRGVVERVGEDDVAAARQRARRCRGWRGSPSRTARRPRCP